MAVIDVAGYVADLKDHSVDHGFHVHDERHFVETYSLRQVWEVELHPEDGCGGPLDLHLALEVDPRTLLSFEDAVFGLPEDEEPPDEYHFPLTFTWALPPLPNGPDLLRLAIDLAGVGGIELPLEVSAIDSYASATDAAERRLNIVARSPVSLARILAGEEMMCEVFDRCLSVSRYLLDSAGSWLGVSDSGPRRTFRRLAVGGIIAIGLGTALSACGNNGTALAKQACTHVNLSLSLLHRSDAGADQAEATELKERALVQLLTALPIAAQAAGQDEQWQALMTTISESDRVPETTLVDALTAQCRLADNSTFDQPPPPSSIPPPDVGP